MHKYYAYGAKWHTYEVKVTYLVLDSNWRMDVANLNSEYWILKKNSVKYVLNTCFNYLYIISLHSFLIALYIKDVKPISSASVVQRLQQFFDYYMKGDAEPAWMRLYHVI